MPKQFKYRNVTGQLSIKEIDERVGQEDVPLRLEHTAIENAPDDEFGTQQISLVFPECGGEEDGSYVWRARRHNSTNDVFLAIHPDGSASLRFPITHPLGTPGH